MRGSEPMGIMAIEFRSLTGLCRLTGFRFIEIQFVSKTYIFSLTQFAFRNEYLDKFLNFGDSSSENLSDKILQFDTEFIDRQRFYIIEIRNKNQNINVSKDRKSTLKL